MKVEADVNDPDTAPGLDLDVVPGVDLAVALGVQGEDFLISCVMAIGFAQHVLMVQSYPGPLMNFSQCRGRHLDPILKGLATSLSNDLPKIPLRVVLLRSRWWRIDPPNLFMHLRPRTDP